MTILLISAMSMAGCTSPPPAPAATPAPAPVASPVISTPAPAAPFATYAAWTPATPATGRPYSKTYSFHGTGDYEEFTFSTDRDMMWTFRLTYPRDGVFTVDLKTGQGELIDVLANEGGAGTSQKSVWLGAGDYYFDISADAPWYITMSTA